MMSMGYRGSLTNSRIAGCVRIGEPLHGIGDPYRILPVWKVKLKKREIIFDRRRENFGRASDMLRPDFPG